MPIYAAISFSNFVSTLFALLTTLLNPSKTGARVENKQVKGKLKVSRL